MEIDIADCLVVVLKALIGLFTRHVHIEPKNLLVVSAQNQIIALGMDGNAGDPLGTGFIFLDYGLFLQVVLEYADLSGCKEVGFGRMEGKALYNAFGLGERFLGGGFTKRMDYDLGGGLNFVSHSRKVVTLWVPRKATYNVLELHCDKDLVFSQVFREGPFDINLFDILANSCEITIVVLFRLQQKSSGSFINFFCIKVWRYHQNILFIRHNQQTQGWVWIPLH